MKRALFRRWRLGASLLIAVGLAVSNAGAVPPCPVDFNQDGSVEVADIFAFLKILVCGVLIDLAGCVRGRAGERGARDSRVKR